ncbi:MAG: dethiobiotin synthase [Candidatus Polarisedimenticolaceae bacterium]|nr:dethiobiotin synthase [Candidatus Polarisedimenticolaceae bacterium]
MRNGYFITGTDTGCGKTEITLGLMQLLQNHGKVVLGMKPVASGAANTTEGLHNEDAIRIQAQGSILIPYSTLNPYVYEPPIAPHLAAEQAGEKIDLGIISSHYRSLLAQADCVVVEGAGGWRVPVNREQSIADLVQMLNLPVILVVGLRLGCINHALLSAESILASGIQLAGWVANVVEPDMLSRDENIATLRSAISAPCLGVVPHIEPPSAKVVAESLMLPPL